jgi:glycosyltransferase involved in cell wall biosynthesis
VKVAYYSPMPPERSGVADYSALLVPALGQRVELVVARRGRRNPKGVDLAVYQIGNDPEAHGWIVDTLRVQPGVVVLHDFVLHHLVAGLTLGRGDAEGYLGAMFRDSGVVGRLLGHGVVDRLVPPLWETRAERFPLTREVLMHARGVFVHSRYVEQQVRALGFERPVTHVQMPAWRPPEDLPPFGIPDDRRPVIGCFGHLTTTKRVPQLLEAFSRLRAEFPRAMLLLVGRRAAGVSFGGMLERYGLGDECVLELDYVEEPRLWSLMAGTDVSVNLRWPTMGETSAMAIRSLVVGNPLVVSDVGWYGELPDDVVEKIPLGPDEVDVLTEALTRLSRDPELRQRLGEAGRAYIRREHDLERVADAYARALAEVAAGDAVRGEVVADVARAAAEVGLEAGSHELDEVAASIREVGLGD